MPQIRKYVGKKSHYLTALIFLVMFTLYCKNQQSLEGNTMEEVKRTEIKIIVGDNEISATMNDNPTAKDFLSLLPLDLKLDDYASTEKVSYLPRKLATEDAPKGYDPSIGDITYYAPWGNLAIFYKDFGHANGLIYLGKIENGIEKLKTSGSHNVRIELKK